MAVTPCREGFKSMWEVLQGQINTTTDQVYLVALLTYDDVGWGSRYEDLTFVDASTPLIVGWTLAYGADRYAPTGLAHEEIEWENDSGSDQTIVGFALLHSRSGGDGPKIISLLIFASPQFVESGGLVPVLPLISLQMCCDE